VDLSVVYEECSRLFKRQPQRLADAQVSKEHGIGFRGKATAKTAFALYLRFSEEAHF